MGEDPLIHSHILERGTNITGLLEDITQDLLEGSF